LKKDREPRSVGVEEVAYKHGFISKDQLMKLAGELAKSGYGEYLSKDNK
jgi:glucose-1-phosphate thymidylyltransferase